MKTGLRQILLGGMLSASCALLPAATESPGTAGLRDHLQSSSPFIPTGWTPPQPRQTAPGAQTGGAAQQPLKIELRGHVDMGDGPRFSLHDPDSGRSFWISPGEQRDGVEVVSYGEDMRSVVIAQGERRGEIQLVQRSDTPLPVAGVDAPGQVTPGEDERRDNNRRRRLIRNREGGEERASGGRMLRNMLRNAETDEERSEIWRRIGEALESDGNGRQGR